MRLNPGVEDVAMITQPARVEGDGAVSRVHDAVGADSMSVHHTFSSMTVSKQRVKR
jgi:hypothetical protein